MDDISLKSTVTAKSPDGARVKGLRLRRTGGRADTRGVFRRLRPNVRTVRARQSRARVFFFPWYTDGDDGSPVGGQKSGIRTMLTSGRCSAPRVLS